MEDVSSAAIRLATGVGLPSENLSTMLQDELRVDTPLSHLLCEVVDGLVSVRLGPRRVETTLGDVLSWAGRGDSVFRHITSLLFPETVIDSFTRAALRSEMEAVSRGAPRVSRVPKGKVAAPIAESFGRRVREGGQVAIIGPSASGKSVLLSSLLRRGGSHEGQLWLDLADPEIGFCGVLAYILTALSRQNPRIALIMDDAQSAPILMDSVLSALPLLETSHIQCIVAGWPTTLELVRQHFGDDSVLFTDPNDLCRRIVGSCGASGVEAEEILQVARGNALVAELATEAYAKTKRVASVADLSGQVYSSLVGTQELTNEQLGSLRTLACLGMFEIDADIELLDRESQASVRDLIDMGICRRNASFVFFGHRTVARLLVHHIDSKRLVDEAISPVRLAVSYLRDAGPSQIKMTLDRLDLINVAGTEDQFGAAFLAQCWTALNVLTSHLSDQVKEDPSWGDNVASAVFAAEAFAEVGMVEEWSACADYIRSRWPVDDTEKLPRHTEGATNESDDFATIQQRMIAEDEEDPVDEWLTGEHVDLGRFHRTWVLGLLLGFEGRAMYRDPERTAGLLRMARESLEPAGSFYPARVPWVTARVLIGLSSCGQTIHISNVASRAATWLRTRPPIGPARIGGIWKSGTGSWNTDLQVTALVLLSLGRAGVDPADRIVKSGLQTLRNGRDEWYRPGKEIDAAQALEAALVLGGQWREYESELRSLLQWCQDSRSWRETRALASVTQDESSKVPAVASALIAVIWETVRAELPLLLQGLVGEGDTGADANIDAQLVRVERALSELGRVIDAELDSRRMVIRRGKPSPQVLDALATWESRDTELERLRKEHAQLRAAPNAREMDDLVQRVDVLGLGVSGAAYKMLAGHQ